MNLIVAKEFGDIGPNEALTRVISANGNHLVMAYGYISESDTIIKQFDEILTFLKKNRVNRVSIFIGLLCKPRMSIDEKITELEDVFKTLLPDSLYDQGVSERVSVYGIKNFHPKLSIMYKEKQKPKSRFPVAALFGSSNLSYSALEDESRYELDMFLSSDDEPDELLESLSRVTLKMLTKAYLGQDVRLASRIDERIHWKGVKMEQFALLEEIAEEEAKEKQLQEFYELKYYTKSATSIEDGIALHTSDVEQEICSDLIRDDDS